MKLLIAILVLFSACKLRVTQWDGVPADRVCTSQGRTSETCISGGKVFQCVQLPGLEDQGPRMLCSRDTVEIKCTNIVNVETVCPGKP